ncbi:MAG: hypothetical protein FLDDKLPJ_03528 [Phycisphaerae bacterium]|nr:hypothetical protein [Phycisphaerae bacterium]
MISKAATVAEYLAQLPPDRRDAVETLRTVFRKNLDKNLDEGMLYGMIGYYVPHRLYPAGYHCDPKQPLPFAGIASQKNYLSIYLPCFFGGEEHVRRFQEEWTKTGKKLDMGKSCIRFKRIEDAPLDVIGRAIARMPMKDFIAYYESAIGDMGKPRKKPVAGAKASPARKPAGSGAKKPATPRAASKPARSKTSSGKSSARR